MRLIVKSMHTETRGDGRTWITSGGVLRWTGRGAWARSSSFSRVDDYGDRTRLAPSVASRWREVVGNLSLLRREVSNVTGIDIRRTVTKAFCTCIVLSQAGRHGISHRWSIRDRTHALSIYELSNTASSHRHSCLELHGQRGIHASNCMGSAGLHSMHRLVLRIHVDFSCMFVQP